MNRIQLLDNLTINKIAAGEVVERPSSVVKELIENSIDAGATSITVEVKDGGTTFIKISDNGCGIAKEQVKTAFLRHATSKIQYVEDLEKVHSLGFRGEALASIAAVSQVEITTKTAEDESGVTLKIEGGTVLDEENTASVTGTSITVKNLFFNVPARKKFLKKPATESGYITDVINKAALGHPEIAFKYINNGNLILHTPGSNDVRTVALFVFGKDFAKKMIELDYKDSTYKIFGLIGKPELSRANRSYEYLFINGRPVKSSIVSSAVEEAYKTRLMTGKFPVFILDINIDFTMVDVNVHPAKLEVRFDNDNDIFDFVFKAVSKCLENETLIPEATWDSKNSKEVNDFFKVPVTEAKQETLYEKAFSPVSKPDYNPTTNYSTGYKTYSKPAVYNESKKIYDNETLAFDFASKDNDKKSSGTSKIDVLLSYNRERNSSYDTAKQNVQEYDAQPVKQPFFNNYKIIGQIFSTYWMIEQGNSIFVIDQHAAHERVLFEEFTNRLKIEAVSSQRLVCGETLSLTDAERNILDTNIELFEKLGFDIEITDGKYSLMSVPFIFKNPTGSEFLTDILDMLTETVPESIYDTKLDAIATMACKAAVKANDKLSYQEAEALIIKLLGLVNPFSCPHGRPTIIELTKYELEKKFKRIV
ncbi:MAG: DNA mismatch repair endonuclease MutL [Lachnospiraceae bacterium]|nr:DNA mismatch repair endonuclease MutL [Lachnospiraceae bacterium]